MRKAGNSIDPLEPAPFVEDPAITEIRDLQSGEVLDANAFIGSHRYDEFSRTVRLPLREGNKLGKYRFTCAMCGIPVSVVASLNKKFFFRHEREGVFCPARTRGTLSMDEIRARKYFGQRESEAHKRLKRLIEISLSVDPEFRTVELEKIWRATTDPKARRQPDVQAVSERFGRIAFEAQVSNSFLDEIAGRRAFYKENGGLLVWVLPHFDPSDRRLAVDDIFLPNNSNGFVVDEETTEVSKRLSTFHMRCFFRKPRREGDTVVDDWKEQIIPFRDIRCHQATQTACFFDYKGEETKLRESIAAESEAVLREIDAAMREEFFALWSEALALGYQEGSEFRKRWNALYSSFADRGLEIPNHGPHSESGFRALINGVLSAKEARPVGSGFSSLIEVAHGLFSHHKGHLYAFGCAVEHYGRQALLEQQDRSGKWARRREELKMSLGRYGSEFEPDTQWLPALIFLFPKIGLRVKGRVDRLEAQFDF